MPVYGNDRYEPTSWLVLVQILRKKKYYVQTIHTPVKMVPQEENAQLMSIDEEECLETHTSTGWKDVW